MTVAINGTSGLTFNDASTQNTAASGFGFKNRIINGAMVIDQRNAGASVSSLNGYSLDRWFVDNNTNTVGLTTQRSTVTPTGFINSLAQTVSGTGASPASSARNRFGQRIEGFNIADLGWGTANAQTVTLSFWVRSSLTGTFSGGLSNNASNRSYVFTYVVSAANTWEYKTVTIAGDTSGTWLTDNSAGININFDIGSGSNFVGTASSWSAGDFFKSLGSVSLIANSGATFYITGVQLEKGSTATSFDYRPIGTELALCQRYCEVVKPSGATNFVNIGIGQCVSTTGATAVYFYQTAKRAQPTVTYTAANTFAVVDFGGTAITCTVVNTDRSDVTNLAITINTASGLTAGSATRLLQNNTASTQVTISAEL